MRLDIRGIIGAFVRRRFGRPAQGPVDGAELYLDGRTGRLRFTTALGDFPLLSTSSSGGAPTTAQYLTLAADATLTVERVFTPGTGLGGTDAGAGSTYTIAINDAGLVSLMAADAGAGLIYATAANTWTNLTLAANKGVYATSASALATYDLTASGRAIGGLTIAAGDLIQGTGAGTVAVLAAVATGNVPLSGGVGVVSAWGKVGLTTHVSGTLPVANGGTAGTTAATARSSLGTTAWPGFGQGRDGALAFDGVTTPVGGAVLVGSTYTLVRDLAPTTLSNTATINTGGFKIRAAGKITNSGSINFNGIAGTGLTPGPLVSGGTCGFSGAGGTGRNAAAAGANGANTGTSLGGAGAAGGAAAGATPAGGTGGGATATAATSGDVRDPPGLETGRLWTSTAVVTPTGGAGGGGGGHKGTSGVSGGGGSGAGTLYIACDEIDNAGSITATGGAGANATGTDNGGGGGGGGGHILLVYRITSGSGLGTVTAAGGGGGSGSGAGATGGTGSSGNVYTVQLT